MNNLKLKQQEIMDKMLHNKQQNEEHLEFDICHHCKCLVHQKYLVQCNYKSSKYGLPIYNENLGIR